MQRFALIALSCFAAANPALAEDEKTPNFAEDTLSGDWGGSRSAAAKKGYLFEGLARVDALRNRGAIGNGGRHVTHLDLKLKMDLEKAAG